MFYARLSRAIALVFLLLLTTAPAMSATASIPEQRNPYESPTSPMDLPWGG